MSSRDEILGAIRKQRIAPVAAPSMDGDWIAYDDLFAQFKGLVESVGGRCERVASPDAIAPLLAALPSYADARQIVSHVPAISGNISLDEIDDPHELDTVDWAIMPGEFAVAENGAIWVTDEGVKHRAIYFIAQHVALVISASEIVPHMHSAYDRITIGKSSLGLFISGPSKTADIEQSLVIGAHGPRSLTVVCVDNP